MSELANTVQKSIQEYVEAHPLLLKLAPVIQKSLTWEAPISYAIIFILVLVNYLIVVSTEWRTLPYIVLLILEIYVLNLALTFVQDKFLKATPEEGKASLDTILNEVFSRINSSGCKGECHDYVKDIAALKKFSETQWYKPIKTVLTFLLLALVSAIFSGSFYAFLLVFGVLLAPGIIHRKLHIVFYKKVWEPLVIPNWNKHVQPQIDKYWGILTGNKPAATTEKPAATTEEPAATTEVPAVTTKEFAPPTEEPAAPTEEPAATTEEPAAPTEEPAATTEEPAATTEEAPGEEGGLDLGQLLQGINELAQQEGGGEE